MLLIDADPGRSGALSRAFDELGHVCRVSENVDDALEKWRKDEVAAVVVAVPSADVDLVSLVQRIRHAWRDVPVVLTANGRTAAAARRAAPTAVVVASRRFVQRIALTVDAILRAPRFTHTGAPRDATAVMRAYLDTTSEGVLVLNEHNGVETWNDRFLTLFGLQSVTDLPRDGRATLALCFTREGAGSSARGEAERLLDDPTTIVRERRAGVGSGRVVSWSSQPIRLGDGTASGRIFTFRDVTAQSVAENQIRFQASLLDQVPSAVIATSLDGAIRYWNRFAAQLHGWESDEVIGRDIRPLIFRAEDLNRGVTALESLRRNGRWHGETVLCRKNGSTFPALLTLTRLPAGQGSRRLVLGVIADLTERHGLEAKLMQSQKMEAVGTLAGGLAHDFNNLLTGVMGSAGLLREMPDLDATLVELIEMIERAALRGRDLCSQMLSFSRAERAKVQPLNTLETIAEVVGIVERTFPRDVRVNVQCEDDLPRLLADRSQISQALMNLFVNARDAMPKGGALTIRASLSTGVPADTIHLPVENDEQYVRLDVVDSGEGMSDEVLARVFEPFYTTKGSGKGTGLGMSMVYSIAKSHGGEVRVWSAPGNGTTVAVFVPVAKGTGEPSDDEPDWDIESYAGTETVLVVDDEAVVRTVGARILRQFGYRALEAASGAEALAIVEQESDSLAVILLDIIMPEMEGAEVFRRLRKRGVQIPVILCSGFSVAGIVDQLLAEGAAGFVQKPYKLRELLPTLRATLDGASPVRVSV